MKKQEVQKLIEDTLPEGDENGEISVPDVIRKGEMTTMKRDKAKELLEEMVDVLLSIKGEEDE
jgi:hypothetical protein